MLYLKHRFYLSLIEIFIVLSLLALVAGSVGFNGLKLVQKEKFRSGVHRIVEQLQVAQDIMLILDTDVRIEFENVESVNKSSSPGILVTFHSEASLSDSFKKITYPLETDLVESVQFETDFGEVLDDFSIKFYSGGSKMSRGVLSLKAKGEEMTRYIHLGGYPHPISSTSEERIEEREELSSYDLYPREVLEEETTLPHS